MPTSPLATSIDNPFEHGGLRQSNAPSEEASFDVRKKEHMSAGGHYKHGRQKKAVKEAVSSEEEMLSHLLHDIKQPTMFGMKEEGPLRRPKEQ